MLHSPVRPQGNQNIWPLLRTVFHISMVFLLPVFLNCSLYTFWALKYLSFYFMQSEHFLLQHLFYLMHSTEFIHTSAKDSRFSFSWLNIILGYWSSHHELCCAWIDIHYFIFNFTLPSWKNFCDCFLLLTAGHLLRADHCSFLLCIVLYSIIPIKSKNLGADLWLTTACVYLIFLWCAVTH